eukprot:Skav203384  [mRNA]  locus=scaffold1379:336778:337905:+ [translate_table: standard]
MKEDLESSKSKDGRSSVHLVPDEPVGSSVWRRFVPAILVYPAWCYAMLKQDAWTASFGRFYIMSLTMIFGSLVAGSTPVGGGAVAFPVMVLYIKLLPEEGRDFSLMVQSVGMSAASFQILYAKRHLCHFWLVLWFTISALPGLILGFEVDMSSRITSLTFTTAVSCFAIAFFYHREVMKKGENDGSDSYAAVEPWDLLHFDRLDLEKALGWRCFGTSLPWVLTALACIFGMTGGFLTAKLGSGADMLAYIFGMLWNSLVPYEAQMSENMLTASSVVVMACCSVLGTSLRILTAEISHEVIMCWAACVPVVVLGAPLGSMLLNPRSTKFLRRCFYVFVLAQFISMGTLQLKDDWVAWLVVLVAILVTLSISHLFLR